MLQTKSPLGFLTSSSLFHSRAGWIRSLFRQPLSNRDSFQILSDLRLEVGQQYSTFEVPPSAPYLILAGDIGRLVDYNSYLAFLARQTQRFDRVFLVLGNHEFYGLSFSAGLAQARKMELEPVLNGKLVLLHQKRFDIPNSEISILGCTLWSRILEEAKLMVQMKVGDFEKIAEWSVGNHNAAYDADISWLKGQVADIHKIKAHDYRPGQERKIVIVTHHTPSIQGTSSPQHINNPWSSAFATDLINGKDWPGVTQWVFGHTHFTTEFKKCGIKVVSNQRGYVFPGMAQKENKDKGRKREFDVKRVVYV